MIYLCVLAAFIPFIWLVCPETKGKSLEEIGVIFGDRHVRVTLDVDQPAAADEKDGDQKDESHVQHADVRV